MGNLHNENEGAIHDNGPFVEDSGPILRSEGISIGNLPQEIATNNQARIVNEDGPFLEAFEKPVRLMAKQPIGVAVAAAHTPTPLFEQITPAMVTADLSNEIITEATAKNLTGTGEGPNTVGLAFTGDTQNGAGLPDQRGSFLVNPPVRHPRLEDSAFNAERAVLTPDPRIEGYDTKSYDEFTPATDELRATDLLKEEEVTIDAEALPDAETLTKLGRPELEKQAKAAGLDGDSFTNKKELAKAIVAARK
jgi:hypothetical protein